MDDLEKQTPVKQSLCGTLRRDGHWKCLSLTLMIIGCLIAIMWCHLEVKEKTSATSVESSINSQRSGPCEDGYIYIPLACMILLYIVYLVECWHSHTQLELRYKCDFETVYNTINKMQATLPVIWWKATCYHYVRRTRQIMRYRNGDSFTSTQVYYERVDSSTAGAAFNFTQCGVKDISRPLSDLEKYPAVKINISKGFSFANVDTEYQFEEQRSRFFQGHETRDDYMEGREGMDLINMDFKEIILAFRDPNTLPWYISQISFWVSSVLLLSWPLRTIMEFQTAHLDYHVHKLFGINYLEGENYSGLMSRVSTMNSSEFEMSIRNNNVIVPSYSEVMLADIDDVVHNNRHYGTIKSYPCKFPRSLTNVTLAARNQTAGKRSLTPTVTMNRVKKFKSCSAFGITEPIESCPNTSTIRQHVQQLLRDRGRFQRKGAMMSQYSISGLSLGHGSVRFQIGTPGTPEDFIMSSSCLYPAVTSSKTNTTLSEGRVISGEMTRLDGSSPGVQSVQDMNNIRPGQLETHTNSLVCAKNRSKCMPESSIPARDSTENSLQIYQQETALTSISDAAYLHQIRKCPILSSSPVTVSSNYVCVSTRTCTTPPTPTSPPVYAEAVRMKLVTTSVIPKPLYVDQANAEIKLIGKGLSEANHKGIPAVESVMLCNELSEVNHKDIPAVESVMLCKGLSEANPKDIPAVESIMLRKGQENNWNSSSAEVVATGSLSFNTYQSSGLRSDVTRLETSRLPVSNLSNNGQHYSHQHHQYHHKQQPKLKVLPKVRANIYCESEDADAECLHSTSLGHSSGETVLDGDKYISRRTYHRRQVLSDTLVSSSNVTFVDGCGTGDDMNVRSTLMISKPNSSTLSSSGTSTSSSVHISRCRSLTSHGRRRETSV